MTFRTEAEFQSAVCQLAKAMGCLVFHPKDVRRSEPGMPDLTIVGKKTANGGRPSFLMRELKMQDGRLRPAQVEWIDRLKNAGVDVDVWRPSDWPERVTRELQEVSR